MNISIIAVLEILETQTETTPVSCLDHEIVLCVFKTINLLFHGKMVMKQVTSSWEWHDPCTVCPVSYLQSSCQLHQTHPPEIITLWNGVYLHIAKCMQKSWSCFVLYTFYKQINCNVKITLNHLWIASILCQSPRLTR